MSSRKKSPSSVRWDFDFSLYNYCRIVRHAREQGISPRQFVLNFMAANFSLPKKIAATPPPKKHRHLTRLA